MNNSTVFKIASLISVSFLIAACGSNKKSSNNNNSSIKISGICTDETIEQYNYVKRVSENGVKRNSRLRDVQRSCVYVENELASTSCQVNTQSDRSRNGHFVSYSEIENFCAEVSAYLNQSNQPSPAPVDRPPRTSDSTLERLNQSYVLDFDRSEISRNLLRVGNGQTQCTLAVSSYENGSLRSYPKPFLSVAVNRLNGRSNYEVVMGTRDIRSQARLNCVSSQSRITIREVNEMLNGVAEFRRRR